MIDIELRLHDVRRSILLDFYAEALPPIQVSNFRCHRKPRESDIFILTYTASKADIASESPIQFAFCFRTADGYEDRHTYEHLIGSKYIHRINPTFVPLHTNSVTSA